MDGEPKSRRKGLDLARPELRFVTYLSPSLPLGLFEAVAEHVERELGCTVSLRSETRISGPERGARDPFSAGESDVGFMCSPSYEWLREFAPPPVELLGVAPVFGDERYAGRPLYFCEVIVRRDSPARSFADLEGGSWAYNDRCSLSGYRGLVNKLDEIGAEERFFERLVHSGSHLRSIELVASGEADAASIDSNALAIRLRAHPERRLRVIESWGPYPVQPVVVRSALEADLKHALLSSILGMNSDPRARAALAEFGVERFGRVAPERYAAGLSAG